MKRIKDPHIATEIFDAKLNVKVKIDKAKWVSFIESHSDYFTWQESTEKGKETLKNIDKVPESFREGLLRGYQKTKAFAEYNLKKEYYELVVQLNEKFGIISTTFMKPIKKEHLQLLLKMAKHCDALLLDNGNKIITLEMVVDDSLS